MESRPNRPSANVSIKKNVPLTWVLIGLVVIICVTGIGAFVLFKSMRHAADKDTFNTQTTQRDDTAEKVSNLIAVMEGDRWLNEFINGGELSSLRSMPDLRSIAGKELDRDLGKLYLIDKYDAVSVMRSLIDRNSDSTPEIAYDGMSFRAETDPSLDLDDAVKKNIKIDAFVSMPKNSSRGPDIRRELRNMINDSKNSSSYGWAVAEVRRGRAVVVYALHLDVYAPELKVFLNTTDSSIAAVDSNIADVILGDIEHDLDFGILRFRLRSPIRQNETLDRCIESFIDQHVSFDKALPYV